MKRMRLMIVSALITYFVYKPYICETKQKTLV